MTIPRALLVLTLATLAAAPLEVHAQTVANGLDAGGKIFVQEYWKNGAPNYCIANFNDADIDLQLKIVTADTVRAQTDAETKVLVEWTITSNSVKHFYIGDINHGIPEEEFMAFYVLGRRVGVLEGAWSHEPESTPSSQEILSYYNLNGEGGYNPWVWMSQERINYTSGQPVEIGLYMRDGAGRISFPKHKLNERPLEQMYIKSAASDTLSVSETADEIVLDTREAVQHVPVHRATLVFNSPRVSGQAVAYIAGWWQPRSKPSGRDRIVSRGIHVKP